MLALMTNIVQFAWWNCKKKRTKQGHWHMYQPVYLLLLATVLVLVQPVGMLVIGSWICDGQFTADQVVLGGANLPATAAPGAKVNGAYPYGFYERDGTYNATAIQKSVAAGDTTVTPTNTYYVDGCSPTMHNFFFDGGASQALTPNTTVGWCIQIFGTYLGFLCMFIGVCQATDLHNKVARKWRAIRGTK